MNLSFQILLLASVAKALDEEDIDDKIEKENANFDDSERRFMDNFNDEEWHVAHLKSTDFENLRRSGCEKESMKEKLNRYRKSLANDPGRLKFVSAQALPFDEKDLLTGGCKVEGSKETNVKGVSTKSVKENATTVKQANNITGATPKTIEKLETIVETSKSDETDGETIEKQRDIKIVPVKNSVKNKEEKAAVDTATTAKIKDKTKKWKKENVQRRDYLFSSPEYEEDVVDFDSSECAADIVDVIHLDQDLIRTYDVECELSLEWRSLE